jgi:hypothetical protein
MAVRARLLSLAHRYVREPRQAQLPPDGWLKAARRTEVPAARAQKALPQQALRALQRARDDEWESRRAQSLREQQASQPEASPPVQEPAPSVRPLVLAHSALPRAQREPQMVSPRLAPHSLVEALQVRLVSSAQLSQPLPSLLFLLSRRLPLGLLPRQRPESFCALSQRRPPESS